MSFRTIALALAATPALLLAQAATTHAGHGAGHAMPAAQANGPEVGQAAPDFTIDVVGKTGAVRPVSLASLRGQTVVLAFFPRVRTSGCTAQLTGYRDKWKELFAGGDKVTMIAISTDASADQQAWAAEANFPMLFGSDKGGKVGGLYGAFEATAGYDKRYLYVIGPDGKVTYVAKPFRQMVETAYTELGQAVGKARTGR
mgnify:FL=1